MALHNARFTPTEDADCIPALGFQPGAEASAPSENVRATGLHQADRIDPVALWQLQNGPRPRLRQPNGGLYWEAGRMVRRGIRRRRVPVSDSGHPGVYHNSYHNSWFRARHRPVND